DRVIQVCLARRALLPLVRLLTETVGTHDHVHVEPIGVRLDGLAQARRQGVEPVLVGKNLGSIGHICFYYRPLRRFTERAACPDSGRSIASSASTEPLFP